MFEQFFAGTFNFPSEEIELSDFFVRPRYRADTMLTQKSMPRSKQLEHF
jgi:hypothetical protein